MARNRDERVRVRERVASQRDKHAARRSVTQKTRTTGVQAPSGRKQPQTRKNDTNQNYIRNFPSIMHLINEYPHIRQLLEETAADKDRPVEMFSTHFLSAMLVPEGESLQGSQYVVVNDPWRQEWERGVQVPVNMHSIPQAHVRVMQRSACTSSARRTSQSAKTATKASKEPFRLPPKRYLSSTDESTSTDDSPRPTEQKAAYDADRLDAAWLTAFNDARPASNLSVDAFERLLESFETVVNERLRTAVAQQETFFRVQFDQSIVCDVCRSPNAADAKNNAMVFCDACNVCVHQQCYGLQRLPADTDSWLCAPCARSLLAPVCVLCGFAGGALKPLARSVSDSTASGSADCSTDWAHLSCALWLPDYSVADAAKMQPVVHFDDSQASRRGAKCALCARQTGVCVTCSQPDCGETFHVTCGLAQGLLRTTWRDSQVRQLVYCRKHSQAARSSGSGPNAKRPSEARSKAGKRPAATYANVKRIVLARTYHAVGNSSGSESEEDTAQVDAITGQKRSRIRVIPQATVAKCYRELEQRVGAITQHFERAARTVLDARTLDSLGKRNGLKLPTVKAVYAYWLLKRRANGGEPLIRRVCSGSLHLANSPFGLCPRSPNSLLRQASNAASDTTQFVVMNTHTKRSVDLNRLVTGARSFIGLRRNLERLRNLCYLVIRRERLRRALAVAQAEIIEQQLTCVPKLPASFWPAPDPADPSPSSSASSFVTACAFSHRQQLAHAQDNKAGGELDETRKLLLNAHVGDSFYENADVLDALELVYEQLCTQQERESWRRVRTEPAVRSEQAATALLKRTCANATAPLTSEFKVPDSFASASVSASASTSSARKHGKQNKNNGLAESTRKRKTDQRVQVKKEPESNFSRKRKSPTSPSTAKCTTKTAKRVRVKKENGLDNCNSAESANDSDAQSDSNDSEYQTADDSEPCAVLKASSSRAAAFTQAASERESLVDEDDNNDSDSNSNESESDGENEEAESESDESGSESESESESGGEEADKENRKAERKLAILNRPRKRAVLAERRSATGPATSKANGNRGGRNSLLGKCSSGKSVSNSSPRKRTQTQANNAARKAALKKLKMSLKVNMRNMQLRPRNGLILRVRSPAKSHN